ncbi:MAG: hypothetical protein HY805_06750 [Nitrospirae bacterium]|nr:hypothetical protein [Nitrospirota bacterium]
MSTEEFWKSGLHPLAQMGKSAELAMENRGRDEKREQAKRIMGMGIFIVLTGSAIVVSVKKEKPNAS